MKVCIHYGASWFVMSYPPSELSIHSGLPTRLSFWLQKLMDILNLSWLFERGYPFQDIPLGLKWVQRRR
jgi:hypothetical protein